jgi:hypothetical protein
MTLVYVLIGFAGLAGAAIAKDDFANVKAPKLRNTDIQKDANTAS